MPTHVGRYELLLELARGGMAELLLGRMQSFGFTRLFAIKRILPHLAQDAQFKQMFMDEGRISGGLHHPNICQVFELGESDGQLFMAMEYLEGVSFADLIAATPGGRPDPRLVGGVLGQAAEGLHYAHTFRDHTGVAKPVVHRDVSPQNLFITVDGVCKLLDFGVSKITTDPSRTKSGVIKGKLPYMPPEQIRGDEVDGRADVFALGVCAWEALAGERLFDRPSDYLTWQAITEEPVPSLSSKWRDCPPAVEAVVLRALAREPAHRQPTAQVFADDLRGTLGFASPAEIAARLKLSCAAQLAATSRRVAEAAAGRPVSIPNIPTGPVTDAGATLDLRTQPASVSMELRDRSAVVERPTVPSRPVASPDSNAHPAVPALSSGVVAPKSRVGLIVIAAVFAAALAVVITVVALRRGSSEAARDAAVVVKDRSRLSDSFDRLEQGFERLDESLKDVDEVARRAERIRAKLHGEDAGEAGTLDLKSDPEAKVFLGDRELGTTPFAVELPPGKHELRVVYGDGRERTATIEIRAGKTTREKLSSW